MRRLGERAVHIAEIHGHLKRDIRAVRLVQHRRLGLHRRLRIDHRRQRLVFHLDQLDGVLGLVAVRRHHGRHPLAGKAGFLYCQRIPQDMGQIEILRNRLHPFGQIRAGDDGGDARRALSRARIDARDAGVGVRRRQRRQMQHAGQGDVVDVTALTQHKTPVFNRWEMTANPLPIGCRHGAPHNAYG